MPARLTAVVVLTIPDWVTAVAVLTMPAWATVAAERIIPVQATALVGRMLADRPIVRTSPTGLEPVPEPEAVVGTVRSRVWAVATPRSRTSTGAARVRSLRISVERAAERGLAVADVAGAKETGA